MFRETSVTFWPTLNIKYILRFLFFFFFCWTAVPNWSRNIFTHSLFHICELSTIIAHSTFVGIKYNSVLLFFYYISNSWKCLMEHLTVYNIKTWRFGGVQHADLIAFAKLAFAQMSLCFSFLIGWKILRRDWRISNDHINQNGHVQKVMSGLWLPVGRLRVCLLLRLCVRLKSSGVGFSWKGVEELKHRVNFANSFRRGAVLLPDCTLSVLVCQAHNAMHFILPREFDYLSPPCCSPNQEDGLTLLSVFLFIQDIH